MRFGLKYKRIKQIALISLALPVTNLFADTLFGQQTGGGNNSTQSQPDITVPPIIATGGDGSAGGSQNNIIDSSNSNLMSDRSSNDVQSVTIKTKPRSISEFQRSVFIRTGMQLKQYGSDLFTTPGTFAPVQNIPVPSNYVLGPGDKVQVQTWGAVSGNLEKNVAPDGTIFIPKVGAVNVTGVNAGNLDSYLKNQVGKSYRNFSLSSNVSKIRTIQVTVAGFAEQPGTYALSSLSTLTNAVFAVGGPSNSGSLRHILLKRNGRVVADFDMYSVLLDGNNHHDVHLLPGDIIYFPPVGKQVAIYNGVKVPAIYEAKNTDTVKDITNYAGGYSLDNKENTITIENINANKALSVNSYPLEQVNNQLVSDGEIIHFNKMTNQYEKAIVLIGAVASPTRSGYKPGMRVKDVIPDKNALLTSSYWDSYAFNSYGKANYNNGNNLQSFVESNDVSSVKSGGIDKSKQDGGSTVSADNPDSQLNQFGSKANLVVAGPVSIPEADINWNYAVIIRTDPADYKVHLIPFNLKKAIAGDPANNLLLQPNDIVNVLSTSEIRNPVKDNPIYVFVDGEVLAPGVYEANRGDTLQDLIQRAGGVSSDAYLFGTELTRESVKKRQQVALNQMLDTVQQGMYAQSSSSVSSSAQASAAQTSQFILQQQQAFIDKMRKVKPSGRIILNLANVDVNESGLPKIALENGDAIHIPPRPGVVDVVGQVFNPASFAYNKGYSVSKYIDMAGTENQFADTSYEYVLRADGTLYSKQQAGWFGSFGSRTLNPGDVVIVPQQIQFGGAIQNLLNWTQILSNFGTAAAAIAVFKSN